MSESETGHAEGSGEPEGEVDPLIGSVIGDRYRIDEKLGVGGMGAVYRAEHVHMKKPVAVKVLHREMTTIKDVVKRFENEAFAAGRIEHPNVALATDFGKLPDGAFYLVLEYVKGRSLTDLIRAEAPLSVDRTLMIARQVAGGLVAAHAAGIVHRDLKPDNIMLIERGGTKDFVKVLDFGIAKISTAEGPQGQLTRLGSVFGTPAYMAPEQAAGQHVDHRADIYSLGLVVYEMLAGRPAFQSAEIIGLLTKQLTEPPPPLPESIDPEVRALVMKMLEKPPADRIQSAEEFVTAVDARLGAAALPPDSTVLGVTSPRVITGSDPTAVAAASVPEAPAPSRPLAGLPVESVRRTAALAKAQLAALAARAVGGESIRVFGRDVPLWLAGAAAGAAIMGTVLTVSLMRGGAPVPAIPGIHIKKEEPARDLSPVITRAETGEQAAMAELVSIPEKERPAEVWMGLARGHAAKGEYKGALHAFRRAVALSPGLARDVPMLRTVRHAVDDEPTEKLALELAAGPLGESGADLLYDVATSRSQKPGDAPALAKSMLDREEVRAHYSKALKIALELKKVTRCEDAKRMLPEAIANADERSVRSLTALQSRRGCGFLSLSDCFSCLRRGDDLKDSLAAAKERKAPQF